MNSAYLYIIVTSGVTFLLRVLPLTLIRGRIKSRFFRSFLFYVPYATLAVMTFPSILTATGSEWSALAALAAAILLAWRKISMFLVSIAACAVVFAVECFL